MVYGICYRTNEKTSPTTIIGQQALEEQIDISSL